MTKMKVGLFAVSLVSLSFSATTTWQAEEIGDWSDPANWSAGIPSFSTNVDASLNSETLKQRTIQISQPTTVRILPIFLNSAGSLVLEGLSGSDSPLVHTNACFDFGRGHLMLSNLTFSVVVDGNAVNVSHNDSSAPQEYARATLGGTTKWTVDGSFLIAGNYSSGGLLTILEPAVLDVTKLYPGRGERTWGGVLQRGGRVDVSTELKLGYNMYSFGLYEMFGGEAIFRTPTIQSFLSVGGAIDSIGVMQIHGGSVTVDFPSSSASFMLGERGRGELLVDGGLFRNTLTSGSLTMVTRKEDQTSFPHDALLAVGGSGVVDLTKLYMISRSDYMGSSTAHIALCQDGQLTVRGTFRRGSPTSTNGTAVLTFDGGTLRLLVESNLQDFLHGVKPVTIYGRGGTIEVTTTRKERGTQMEKLMTSFRSPTGWGVFSVQITDGGEGYLMPPAVSFVGGAGRDARGFAQIDYERGCVTNVLVVCPGEGYTQSDPPQIVFTGASAEKAQPSRFATATPVMAENQAGSLMVQGEGKVMFAGDLDLAAPLKIREGAGAHFLMTNCTPSEISIEGELVNGSSIHAFNQVTNRIHKEIPVVLGGVNASASSLMMYGADDAAVPHVQQLDQISFAPGKLFFGAMDSIGSYQLQIGQVADRTAGSLFYWNKGTDEQKLEIQSFSPALLSGNAGAQVVVGAFPASLKRATTGGFLTVDETGALTPLSTTNSVYGAGENPLLTDVYAATETSVNSLRMGDGAALSLPDGARVESGMIEFQSGSKLTSIQGGTLTSGNGRDLIVYDRHTLERRQAYQAKAVIDSQIVDAGVDAPIALTVGGYKDSVASGVGMVILKVGPFVKLANAKNSYSGGTYLNDCAVDAVADGSFGAAPTSPQTNIFVSGMSQIRANEGKGSLELHANRGIHLAYGSALSFTGDRGYVLQTRVNGPVTGQGVLISAEWAGGGRRSITELCGDLSGFSGTYGVMGTLRIPNASTLSSKSTILFCESSNLVQAKNSDVGDGFLETSGVIDRTVGIRDGQVAWGCLSDVQYDLNFRDPGTQNSGGFSAGAEGPLTVSLRKSDGGTCLQWGADRFIPATLKLQSGVATNPLTWTASVDIHTTASRDLQVGRESETPVVYWSGSLTNSYSTGALSVYGFGNLCFTDEAKIEESVQVRCVTATVGFDTDRTIEVDGLIDFTGNLTRTIEKRGMGSVILRNTNTLARLSVKEGAVCIAGERSQAVSCEVGPEGELAGDGTLAVTEPCLVEGALRAQTEMATPSLLTVDGDVTLNGALDVPLTAESNGVVQVSGAVAFGTNAVVTVSEPQILAQDKSRWLTVMTFSSASGKPTCEGLPKGWSSRVLADQLQVYYAAKATVILLQ